MPGPTTEVLNDDHGTRLQNPREFDARLAKEVHHLDGRLTAEAHKASMRRMQDFHALDMRLTETGIWTGRALGIAGITAATVFVTLGVGLWWAASITADVRHRESRSREVDARFDKLDARFDRLEAAIAELRKAGGPAPTPAR